MSTRFKSAQHRATEASIAEISSAASRLATGGTSSRRVGKKGSPSSFFSAAGFMTFVPQRGHFFRPFPSSTPQLTQ